MSHIRGGICAEGAPKDEQYFPLRRLVRIDGTGTSLVFFITCRHDTSTIPPLLPSVARVAIRNPTIDPPASGPGPPPHAARTLDPASAQAVAHPACAVVAV